MSEMTGARSRATHAGPPRRVRMACLCGALMWLLAALAVSGAVSSTAAAQDRDGSDDVVLALSRVAEVQAEAGDRAGASATLAEARALAESFDGARRRGNAMLEVSFAHARLGDVDGALAIAEALADDEARGALLIQLALAQPAAGAARVAHYASLIASRADQIDIGLSFHGVAAIAHASAGDPAAARAATQRVEPPREQPVTLLVAALLALQDGATAEARALIDEAEARATALAMESHDEVWEWAILARALTGDLARVEAMRAATPPNFEPYLLDALVALQQAKAGAPQHLDRVAAALAAESQEYDGGESIAAITLATGYAIAGDRAAVSDIISRLPADNETQAQTALFLAWAFTLRGDHATADALIETALVAADARGELDHALAMAARIQSARGDHAAALATARRIAATHAYGDFAPQMAWVRLLVTGDARGAGLDVIEFFSTLDFFGPGPRAAVLLAEMQARAGDVSGALATARGIAE